MHVSFTQSNTETDEDWERNGINKQTNKQTTVHGYCFVKYKWPQMGMNGHDHFSHSTRTKRSACLAFNSYAVCSLYIMVLVTLFIMHIHIFPLCFAFFRSVSLIFDQREFRFYFSSIVCESVYTTCIESVCVFFCFLLSHIFTIIFSI